MGSEEQEAIAGLHCSMEYNYYGVLGWQSQGMESGGQGFVAGKRVLLRYH